MDAKKKYRTLSNEQLKKLSDFISAPRFKVKENISRYVYNINENQNIACVTTDISQKGICIVTRDNLEDGTKIHLKLPKQDEPIDMEVLWSEQDPQKEGIYHTGLEAKTNTNDIVKCFEGLGLMKQKILYKEPDPTKFDYQKLQPVLTKLHAQDRGLLAKTGFGALQDTHTAYSLRYQEASIIVIVPLNIKPSTFETMDSYDAAKLAIIIKEEPSGLGKVRWVKVWPSVGLLREKISAELQLPDQSQTSSMKVEVKEGENSQDVTSVDVEVEDF